MVTPPRSWKLPDRTLQFGETPCFMGILNVTPDSFSDGGRYADPGKALEQALTLVNEGAGIIDVGGESTRPGAESVEEGEELRRVLPVVERLAKELAVPVSIDTYKSGVAREALQAGAQIVNDISGMTFDPEMPRVCAEGKAGVICMHIQGTPQTMQRDPRYGDAVMEIREWLRERCAALLEAGVERGAIVVDPGIGFGKRAEHNLEILSNLAAFHELGYPVCIGHSRKRFLGKILGRPVDERSFGTVGVSLALAEQGVEILRLHEIAPTRDTLTAWRTVHNYRG